MPRILVVDDDRLIRSLLTAIFEMRGVECVTASGGGDALRHIAESRFDLVLLDLMMPGLDGFGVLAAIEMLPPPHPPIMIATAAAPGVVGRVPAQSIAAILAKPFDVDELIATAETLIRREQVAELAASSRPRSGAAMRILGAEAMASRLAPRRRPRTPLV